MKNFIRSSIFACAPWSPTSLLCSFKHSVATCTHNPSGPLLRLTSCAFPCHGGFTSTPSFKCCKPSPSSSGGGAKGTLVKFLLLAAVFQLVLQTHPALDVLQCNCDQRPLGHNTGVVSLFACALLCRSRSSTTLARRFLETAAVCGP